MFFNAILMLLECRLNAVKMAFEKKDAELL